MFVHHGACEFYFLNLLIIIWDGYGWRHNMIFTIETFF